MSGEIFPAIPRESHQGENLREIPEELREKIIERVPGGIHDGAYEQIPQGISAKVPQTIHGKILK